MESRTELLLSEIRKCPRPDKIVVVRRLLEDLAQPVTPSPPSDPPVMSAEEMAELQRRLDSIDDALPLDEFMALLDREVASRTGKP
jgi:hypothetical protein